MLPQLERAQWKVRNNLHICELNGKKEEWKREISHMDWLRITDTPTQKREWKGRENEGRTDSIREETMESYLDRYGQRERLEEDEEYIPFLV